jgi:hypothetical protein
MIEERDGLIGLLEALGHKVDSRIARGIGGWVGDGWVKWLKRWVKSWGESGERRNLL